MTLSHHNVPFTDHGNKRRHQRCSSGVLFDLLLTHFDRDIYIGDRTYAWSISREYLAVLVERGTVTKQDAERISGLAVLVVEDSSADPLRVRSVVRDDGGFGQYVRPAKKRSHPRRRARWH